MRIHLKTTPSTAIVPFNHQHKLTGVLHKWFGWNDFHDDISLYSFSRLQGAKRDKNGISFPDGATWFISSWNDELVRQSIASIQQDPTLFAGLTVTEILLQETPELSNRTHFGIASPIYIQRKRGDGTKQFYFFDDERSAELMTETLHHKMKVAQLPHDETLSISFDKTYRNPGTKKIAYKKGAGEIQIRANWCPVIIEGANETKAFAWNVGIGNSTGIGFGAIK